jgi:transcriptional regulator with XRE-family HTH domain
MRKVKVDIQAKFGAHIRKLRQDRGWSQEQLAYKANLHPTYVSGIERGVRNLSLIHKFFTRVKAWYPSLQN